MTSERADNSLMRLRSSTQNAGPALFRSAMQIKKSSSEIMSDDKTINNFGSPTNRQKGKLITSNRRDKTSGLSQFDAGELEFNENPSYADDTSSMQSSSLRRLTQHSRSKKGG